MSVGAVAAATHDPDDEGVPRHRLQEDDGGESSAAMKTSCADSGPRVWQCEGRETTAPCERHLVNAVE